MPCEAHAGRVVLADPLTLSIDPRELIRVEDVRAAGGEPRALRDAHGSGRLIRIRRGTYVLADVWAERDPRERHLLAVRAAAIELRSPYLIAGRSAGAVWGLPFGAEWPHDVTVLGGSLRGGKSEPGVRRTAASFASASGVLWDGIPVTTRARTALDMARSEPFPRAVAIVDRALWSRDSGACDHDELIAALTSAAFARGARHLARVVEFATALSDSPYESMARAVMAELGFPSPELQCRFRDEDGIIRPDFFWRRWGVAGEFDGRSKYTRDEYTRGDPAAVVYREKLREDRLRRFPEVRTVVRFGSDEVDHPWKLARLLVDAGLPRGVH